MHESKSRLRLNKSMEDNDLLRDNSRITSWKFPGYFGGVQEAANEDHHEFHDCQHGKQ